MDLNPRRHRLGPIILMRLVNHYSTKVSFTVFKNILIISYACFNSMYLYQGISMKSTVFSTDGHVRLAMDIFVMALKYIHSHILEALAKHRGE